MGNHRGNMLKIKRERNLIVVRRIATLLAVVLLCGGGYLLSLVGAPAIAPLVFTKPIDVNTLPSPKKTENRIIIPKIGVNVVYGKGISALEHGAQWRYPERGDPESGGNFIIAAHRFTLAPTPGETVTKSPFFSIDKLVVGDKIVVDYNGTRFGYEIDQLFTVTPEHTEIEARTSDAKLTLYSCELSGPEAGRVVVVAKPLGQVALNRT